MRLLAVFGMLLVAGLLLPTLSHGQQEEGLWEFSLFGAKAKLDNSDPLALVKHGVGDFDADGTATDGILTRSLDLEDGTFLGFRLGYNWSKTLGSEVIYDRNHFGADYHHTIEDTGTGSTVADVSGRVGVVLTSYQVGVLYYPLGKMQTPWQPYVTVAGGYVDVDFSPSGTLRPSVKGGQAVNSFGVEIAKEDNGMMLGYGLGLKYYIASNVAVRGEIRGKNYELFDERRDDREISLGISFFAPGSN